MSGAQACPGAVLALAGKAAQIILENGAETYRVEDTVLRLCHSYGYEDADIIALSTGVLISISVPGDSTSVIRRVRKRGMNLDRVNAVNDLSRRIAGGGVPVEAAMEEMQAIACSKTPPMAFLALMSALAAASFALMFGGNWIACAVAAVCGAATQVVSTLTRRAAISLVLVSLVGGLVCSAITMAAYALLDLTPADVETTLAGAIMPLISGLMMTNAVRDTLRGDLLSGMARGMEALLVAIMVALGISLLLRFYIPPQSDVVLLDLPWPLALLYAGVATLCFCPLLQIPRRAMIPASLLGAAAYGGFLLFGDVLGAGETLALFLAAAVIALLCDLLARRMRMITTIFLCAALIPLVPGLGLYRTMRALLLGQSATALAVGLQALFAVGAIALGAAIGSLRMQRPETSKKRRRPI